MMQMRIYKWGELMQFENLFLRCWLCRGFNSASGRHLANYLKQHATIDVQQLPTICKIMPRFHATFIADFKHVAWQKYCQYPFITFNSPFYPPRLFEIYDAPPVLFYQGNIKLLAKPTMVIVGARQANGYTCEVLHNLIPHLVNHNVSIISGLASGADSYAHQITLQNHGNTIAVIGTGLNCYYPQQNCLLQQQIAREGLLLSEYLPDVTARRYHFPQRNRIIAGLCHTLLITQARQRSGSLITANLALEDNRNVMAVPGNINLPLSQGCNELIDAGATPYLGPQQVLESLKFFS